MTVAAFAAVLSVAGCDTASCVSRIPSVKGYTKAQVANAAVIACTGAQMGVSRRGQQIAVAVASQESSLGADTCCDHDSVGLYQQRPSWGSRAERNNPAKASRLFYQALKKVHGWETLPLTVAAQKVQRSAHPGAYADDAAGADRILNALSRQARKEQAGKKHRARR